MKKHKLSFVTYGLSLLLAGCCSLTSCDDAANPFSSPSSDYSVRFTCSSIQVSASTRTAATVTRAYNNMWETGDVVGIYMVPHTIDATDVADLASDYAVKFSNVPYVTAESGGSVSLIAKDGSSSIKYPLNGDNVNFIAYYPYNSVTHTTNNNFYPIDVAIQSPLKDIDLLYHKGTGAAYSRSSAEVGLNFFHQLSKLIISVVPASAEVEVDLTSTTAGLTGFPTRNTFNLGTGELDAPTTVATTDSPIVPVIKGIPASDNILFEAILLPNSGSDFARVIELTIDGKSYTHTLPESIDMMSGKAYTYNFRFTGTAIVLAQNTVTNWEGIAFGDSQFAVSTTFIELKAGASADNGFTVTTNSQSTPTWKLSATATNVIDTESIDWLTNTVITKGFTVDGFTTYALTYNTTAHTSTTDGRTAFYHVTVDDMTLVVRAYQNKQIYLNADLPSPFSFNLPAADQRNLSFTVTTNSSETVGHISYSLDGSTPVSRPDWLFVESPTCAVNGDVATFTTIFAVSENCTFGTVRTAYIHITVDGQTQKIPVTQVAVNTNDIAIIPLTEEANCYMVEPGGKLLQFPVNRAVQYGGMNSTATFIAEVLWDDNGVIGTPSISGTAAGSLISVVTTNNVGNALIAIKSEGVIYWSYHIWVTSTAPVDEAWTNNGYTTMAYNLGATSNYGAGADTGLVYQYGRKDPFRKAIPVKQSFRSQAEVRANPTTLFSNIDLYTSWANENIPCPYGWTMGTTAQQLSAVTGGTWIYDEITECYRNEWLVYPLGFYMNTALADGGPRMAATGIVKSGTAQAISGIQYSTQAKTWIGNHYTGWALDNVMQIRCIKI